MGMWDSVLSGAGKAFGYVGDTANAVGKWSTNNPGAANILGGVLGAGGNYMAERMKLKAEEKKIDNANRREDELHQVARYDWGSPTGNQMTGQGSLTGGGLLAKMQQKL